MKKVINVVGAIIFSDNKILCAQRSEKMSLPLMWEFPGGKVEKNESEVNLEENETGISPGQACVFYSKNKFGDKVLGGGWIMKTINKYLST